VVAAGRDLIVRRIGAVRAIAAALLRLVDGLGRLGEIAFVALDAKRLADIRRDPLAQVTGGDAVVIPDDVADSGEQHQHDRRGQEPRRSAALLARSGEVRLLPAIGVANGHAILFGALGARRPAHRARYRLRIDHAAASIDQRLHRPGRDLSATFVHRLGCDARGFQWRPDSLLFLRRGDLGFVIDQGEGDGPRGANGFLPVRDRDTRLLVTRRHPARPWREGSRTGCGSSVVPSGVMKMRTPFSAARRGDGRSHDREKSSAIFPFAIRAMRCDVTASSAGMSLAPPTIETWPSHWIPSASNGCQIWKEGRSTTGSGLLELSGRRDMFERSSPD